MRWDSLVKNILGFFLVFSAVILVGNKTVFGGYTQVQIVNEYCGGSLAACGNIDVGTTGSTNMYYAPGQKFSGYYQAPNGLFYPIGGPAEPNYNPGGSGGSGSGPDEPPGCVGAACCTGVYGSCTGYAACSTTCGPGTQTRGCFDTGCGTLQTQSRSCQVNDPTVFVSWGACSTNCGPGTRNWINQCGTVGGSGACMVNDPNIWLPPTTPCSVKCGTGTWDLVNQCGTTQAFACNTSVCPAWTKLKDSSFISVHPLTDMIALAPAVYDSDDTTQQYFIVGADGVVAAPAISIEISNITSTAKTGNPEYKAIYTPSAYSLTPSTFLSYVKARKEFKVITDLGGITGSGVYVYNGDISISSNVTPFNQPYKVVLIATGTITISAAPGNTFSPTGTAAIIAPTINFNGAITEAQGIFIGNTISTGTNAAQGLKIIGNLIAQTALSNNREWPTTQRPSVFIKFDQTKYISLLSYLSTASYQWRQIQ